MNTGFYYEKLKSLIDSKRLSLILMVAPPRTNSSLVEHAMGNSPDIKHECHEPFLGDRKEGFNSDQGYKQIYDSIGGDLFEQSKESTTVAVKEMSQWIGINDEYKNLIELTNSPVLILIRNPLLSVESRMRRVLSTLDMRINLDFQRWLLNYVAKKEGFVSWEYFLNYLIQRENKNHLSFLRDNEGLLRLYDTALLTIQNELLDYMAKKDGYVNWRELISKKLYTEKDFKYFGDIFKVNTRRVGFKETEFKKLDDQVKYLESNRKSYYVVDTTDLRAIPDIIIKEICRRMHISYSLKMIDWGTEPVNFYTEQNQEFELVWYDTLYASTKIKPPIDIPLTLSMFPDFVQMYLKKYNLPIYAKLSKSKITSKNRRRYLNEKEFNVDVSKENIAYLKRIGVIRDIVTEGQISVKIKFIDPIYALTNEPKLFNDAEFIKYKEAYMDALTIIRKSLDEPKKKRKKKKK
ncbi:MAG: hypothetical protein HY005_03390 [Candidatus Staskawiczbacteria bacterium]|nr:hypothetical protein [Candidatus Staskawiczbacteria bacterium]